MNKQEALKKLEIVEKEAKELKSYIENLDKKKGYWKPENGERYWYIDSEEGLGTDTWTNDIIDVCRRLEMGNVFRTEEEALKQVELTKAIVRVRQYIAENCEEFEPDWSNCNQYKYEIYYDGISEKLDINSVRDYKSVSLLPFLGTKEDAQKVLDNCEKDLNLIFEL